MTKFAMTACALAYLFILFVGFRLLGPTHYNPSEYASQALSLGEGKIYIRSHSTYEKQQRIFISNAHLGAPVRFYFGVEQSPKETITVDRVLLRQDTEESYAVAALKSKADGDLERLEDREKGPFYRLVATPDFSSDIDIEIKLTRCRDDTCTQETHQTTVMFEEKPTEFRFALIAAMMSI